MPDVKKNEKIKRKRILAKNELSFHVLSKKIPGTRQLHKEIVQTAYV